VNPHLWRPFSARAKRLKTARKAPRVALLLALVLLIPVTSLAAVTGASALSSWHDRQRASDVRTDVAKSSAIMNARALVLDEALPSIAVANSSESGLSLANLSRLSGVDFATALHQTRPKVDQNPIFRSYPKLAVDLATLQTVIRPEIDSGHSKYQALLKFFTGFSADVDTVWKTQLAALDHDVTASKHGTGALTDRISVLPVTYALLSNAVARAVGVNELIRQASPTIAKALISKGGAYAATSAGILAHLGPKAVAAWKALQRDPALARFDALITQTVSSSLIGQASPLATSLSAHALAFADGRIWLADLQQVIQAASVDVSDVAHTEELAAMRSFQFAVAIFLLSVLLAAGGAVLLTRSVVRPLRRLAAAARQAAEGDFTLPASQPTGPREVADTIMAVDDMTAVLAALESFTVTLANDPTSPSLDVPLPGRTGLALQTTLDRLRESVREAERRQVALREVATRDGLTGLLNRNAAIDAITLELARAERLQTSVMALFIDLDGLKSINDTHGHRVGDDAIRLAAHALRGASRGTDVVARLGGDEFLVAGGLIDSHGEVQGLADRLHSAVANSSLEAESLAVALRCSIGIAISEPGDTAESLINKADQALYAAKKKGRNQTSWRFQPVVPRQEDQQEFHPEIVKNETPSTYR
jgi:diguanylate cyclase (GGDEF)-like protein